MSNKTSVLLDKFKLYSEKESTSLVTARILLSNKNRQLRFRIKCVVEDKIPIKKILFNGKAVKNKNKNSLSISPNSKVDKASLLPKKSERDGCSFGCN